MQSRSLCRLIEDRNSGLAVKLDWAKLAKQLWSDFRKRYGVNKPVKHQTRNLRQAQQRNHLAPRTTEMIAGTKDRVANTCRMIAQSKTLLSKSREALESSRVLRQIPRRMPETKP